MDKQIVLSELRTRYHFEANMADNGNPVLLSANVTRQLGRKMSFAATMNNVFRLPASLSGTPRNALMFPLAIFYSDKLRVGSGPGAQEGRPRPAVLPGSRASLPRRGRRQNSGNGGAERGAVEFCAWFPIRAGR